MSGTPSNTFGLTAKSRKEIPGGSEAEDRLLAMITALTGELSITRERLDTLERLVESAGVVTQAQVESFSANEKQFEQRLSLRQRLIAKVFRPLRAAAERDLASVTRTKAANKPAQDVASADQPEQATP